MPRIQALRQMVNVSSRQARFLGESPDSLQLGFEGLVVTLSKQTGRVTRVTRDGKASSLTNGPRLGKGDAVIQTLTTNTVGGDVLVAATLDGDLREIVWRLRCDGWLQCRFTYRVRGPHDSFGALFDFPEQAVRHKRWLGNGPYRVWKNRLRGGTLNFWENDYNDTIPGYRGWVYPEFKGFFAEVCWLELETAAETLTVVPENIPFIQVLTPDLPPDELVGQTRVSLTPCGLGFLHAIPSIGSKFKPAHTTGPQGQPNVPAGEYSGAVNFLFGPGR
jgi:hypothetical protein